MKKEVMEFVDLDAWKCSHRVVLQIYALTKKFPTEELFGLESQMRRAAISVTANIAEGFGRMSSKEKTRFFSIARGSVTELQNHLLASRDLRYINMTDFQTIFPETIRSHQMINGLMRKWRQQSIQRTTNNE